MRRNVFWSSFPVCWHEFNTHFHLKPKKVDKSSQIREEKKRDHEKPQASVRSKCLASR